MARSFYKSNPHATPKWVIFWAVITPAWSTPLFFFLFPAVRENWRWAVPALILLGAFVGALGELHADLRHDGENEEDED